MIEDHDLLDEVGQKKVSKIREQYYYMVSHIDALVRYFHEESYMDADIFVLPKPVVNDVGKAIASFVVQHKKGQEAVQRALHHFTDDKLKVEQAGVMANRLPGVLHVQCNNPSDVIARIAKINHEKDILMGMIKTSSACSTEQFLLTKAAVPYAIRKAIGRHMYVFNQGELKSVGFSVSKRSSMSKSYKRDYWLEKLDKSEKFSAQQTDAETWADQIEKERKLLSGLAPTAMLRIVRPIRKTPIVNLLYEDDRKYSPIAHSPIIVLNDRGLKVNPMKNYIVGATGDDQTATIIPRWHLKLLDNA